MDIIDINHRFICGIGAMMRIFSKLTLLAICIASGASGAWFYQYYTASDNAKFYPSVAQVKAISQLANSGQYIAQAQAQITQILQEMYRPFDWKVKINWS
ncbi:hypothetical protein [Cysteiniphilum sp. 6C5]|uniref:hypothetical protein n=1 Tax=unclassified Cysteiniphilum TaxID=2610889 RepID=UPI003F832CC9